MTDLHHRISDAVADAISEAITREMRPALEAAGMTREQAARIVWRPSIDTVWTGFLLGRDMKLSGQVTDLDHEAAGKFVETAAELLGGTHPITVAGGEIDGGVLITLETEATIEDIPVTIWGRIG